MIAKWYTIAVVMLSATGCGETAQEDPVGVTPVTPVTPVTAIAIITIDPVPFELLPGSSAQLSAHALGPSGEVLPDRVFTFSGNNPAVAIVSNTGGLTSIAPGAVRVTAASAGRSGSRDILVNYPVPTITSINPGSVPTIAPTGITVRGTGFYLGTVARMSGIPKSTTWVSSTELRINLTAVDVATEVAAAITVFNPVPGGGTSGSMPLLVRATAVCDVFAPLSLTAQFAGLLDAGDCNNGTAGAAFYQDFYNFATPSALGVRFTLSSAAFNPFLVLTDATNRAIILGTASAARPNPAGLNLLLPASTFTVIAGATNSNGSGAYTFASTVATFRVVTGCEVWYVVPPLDLNEAITKADCGLDPHRPGQNTQAASMHEAYWDEYRIVLRAGQTVTITFESTAFDGAAGLINSNGDYVAWDNNGAGGTNAKLVYTATDAGVYKLEVSPWQEIGEIGAYRLRIN